MLEKESQLKEISKDIVMFDRQYEAFYFTTQFGAVIAGVQSGKTFEGCHWAGQKIDEFSGKNGLISAPTYKILQHSTLEKFFSIHPYLRKYYKQQQGVIELPTGGKVFIRSADEPLGIEGMTIHWFWLDEAGMMARLIWTVVRSRVSITGGQGLITTTPYNMGWLYLDFYMRAGWINGVEQKSKAGEPSKDKDLSVFTWRSIDNPFFKKDFYEKERLRLRAEEFARRYMGEFRKMEGLVWDLPLEKIIDPIEKIEDRADFIGAGIDWGWRNPAAIPVLVLLNNSWYVVDEWYETQKTTAEIIQAAKNLRDKWRIQRFYPDPSEPDRIKECQDAGLNMAETNNNVKSGISIVQQIMKDGRFYVFKTCPNWISEQSGYHYPEGQEGKPFKDEPEKINDHLMTGTRYVIHSYQPAKEQFVPDYKQRGMGVKRYYPKLGV